MRKGKRIESLEHAEKWCVRGYNRVILVTNKGEYEHGWKLVAKMPFKQLINFIQRKQLYESI